MRTSYLYGREGGASVAPSVCDATGRERSAPTGPRKGFRLASRTRRLASSPEIEPILAFLHVTVSAQWLGRIALARAPLPHRGPLYN